MKRTQLDDLLRRLAPLVGNREVTMIGSQCVHAVATDVPAEVLMSREVDILFPSDDPSIEVVERELGEDSPFRAESGVYVDPMTGTFPYLPDGWEQRSRVIDVGTLKARCLDVHDLALSKLAAGRLKDTELLAALIDAHLVDVTIVQNRLASIADLHLRAVLTARLQLVLENVG